MSNGIVIFAVWAETENPLAKHANRIHALTTINLHRNWRKYCSSEEIFFLETTDFMVSTECATYPYRYVSFMAGIKTIKRFSVLSFSTHGRSNMAIKFELFSLECVWIIVFVVFAGLLRSCMCQLSIAECKRIDALMQFWRIAGPVKRLLKIQSAGRRASITNGEKIAPHTWLHFGHYSMPIAQHDKRWRSIALMTIYHHTHREMTSIFIFFLLRQRYKSLPPYLHSCRYSHGVDSVFGTCATHDLLSNNTRSTCAPPLRHHILLLFLSYYHMMRKLLLFRRLWLYMYRTTVYGKKFKILRPQRTWKMIYVAGSWEPLLCRYIGAREFFKDCY